MSYLTKRNDISLNERLWRTLDNFLGFTFTYIQNEFSNKILILTFKRY